MSTIEITLPDGSKQPVPAGTSPLDIAKSISPRLADAAIVAKVNGELYDLSRPLETDASVEILTSKNPEALQVYRHSTAHLLASPGRSETSGSIATDTGSCADSRRRQALTAHRNPADALRATGHKRLSPGD